MNKTKAKQIVNLLSKEFLDKPALNFSTPFELLIATRLSAQCTDKRVNIVTKELFERFKNDAMVQRLIEPTPYIAIAPPITAIRTY